MAGFVAPAFAVNFNIPSGDLETALNIYVSQTGVHLIVSEDAIRGVHSKGAKGDLSPDQALFRILAGSGFVVRNESGVMAVVRDGRSGDAGGDSAKMNMAAAPAPTISGAALETVTVTSSKVGGDVQSIPISITAMSQEQLTATQTAGGPDLIKQVPNMTFSKTNFTGYNIQIRGIGTQAISVTTDPAVAVAFNDMPFIRNHFFEQEFYDVSQVEVLRGPQGTLYGRNATAGVVNLVSAKPTDQFEAMASVDIGNYQQRRFEGMINMPLVDDRLDIRVAGEWTKRQGYSFNETTDNRIDGRDLWSSRVTIGWKPFEKLQTYLVWEHFSEDDDRIRSSKQLCKTDTGPSVIDGIDLNSLFANTADPDGNRQFHFSQGCVPVSLYSSEAFQVPDGFSLPYYTGATALGAPINTSADPYAETVQSQNLRDIQSQLNPIYRAKNDLVELNADYAVTSTLTFTSQTGFNQDFLWSTEDYNRFDTAPGIFVYTPPDEQVGNNLGQIRPDGFFCDPQLGCSNRLVLEDLSDEHAWQLSQEFRLASSFAGPFNFSMGGNYLHYETEENYYVFINSVTLAAAGGPAVGGLNALPPWVPGVSDNLNCLPAGPQYLNPVTGASAEGCIYIDPNPLTKLNNKGHNYFLSQNPYILNSYAGFGEAYYNVIDNLKLTAGLRWTEDQKHFPLIPSELVASNSWGYPIDGVVDQQWDELTGRFNASWTPKLDFTDQTLVYGSYAHGYKAGGANPPGPIIVSALLPSPRTIASSVHPLTFEPEFVDAFELGTKNRLFDGTITLNADVFYYNYENYQISEIVDRTSINLNFDAHVKGAELEASWEPLPGLRFNFAGGYEDARLAKGTKAIDLMDRTAGDPNYFVLKPGISNPSNCIFPTWTIKYFTGFDGGQADGFDGACIVAYKDQLDPLTDLPYIDHPSLMCSFLSKDGTCRNPSPLSSLYAGYPGFDPASAPNNGEGIFKNLGGNQMPNAPPFTVSAGAQYTLPITQDWATTLRGDFYWQSNSFWRVFNDMSYDRLHGYDNVNLTLIFTSQSGWQVMLYDKNVLDTTAITGAFLNSDDSGLTTNVFLTDPKLIGIRVTKNW